MTPQHKSSKAQQGREGTASPDDLKHCQGCSKPFPHMRVLCSEAAQLSCACHRGCKPRVPWKLPDGGQHSAGSTSPAQEGTDTFSTPHLAQHRKSALFSRAPGTNTGKKAVLFSPSKATILRDGETKDQGPLQAGECPAAQELLSWRASHLGVTPSPSGTPRSCHFSIPNPGTHRVSWQLLRQAAGGKIIL